MLNYNESNDYEYFHGMQDVPGVVICSEEYEAMIAARVRSNLIEVPTREQKIGKFKVWVIDIKYIKESYNQDALDYVRLNWLPESQLVCTFYRNGGEVRATYKTLTFTIIDKGVVTGYNFRHMYPWDWQMIVKYNPVLKIEIEGQEVYSQSFSSYTEAFEQAEAYLRAHKKDLLSLKYKESEVNYSAKGLHASVKKRYEIANPYRLAKFQLDVITAMKELTNNIKWNGVHDTDSFKKWSDCDFTARSAYYNAGRGVLWFTHYNGCPCGDCQTV